VTQALRLPPVAARGDVADFPGGWNRAEGPTSCSGVASKRCAVCDRWSAELWHNADDCAG